MKFRVFGAGVVAATCLLAPQQAQALTVVTAYQPFKIFQASANNVPMSLNFSNFNAVAPGPGLTLTGVGFRIAGPGGTGSATVGGNPQVSNPSGTQSRTATVNWAPAFTTTANASFAQALAGNSGTYNPVPCVTQQGCPPPGAGGISIPESALRFLQLNNSYASSSTTIASLTGAAVAAYTTGTVKLNTGSATFTGTGTTISTGLPGNLLFGFDPDPNDPDLEFSIAKPYIDGTIALEYQYDAPVVPGAKVPGPLPLLGGAAAFGWSRRLKKRVISAV